MGLSIRARRWLDAQMAAKAAARAAAVAEQEQQAAEFARTHLDRERAAAACGVSVHSFKRLQMAGRGPRPTKMGSTRQARTYWQLAEIDAYLADPAAYDRARAAAAAGAPTGLCPEISSR